MKKVIRNRDIVVMEEKTIADWESEKRTTSTESTDKDRLEEMGARYQLKNNMNRSDLNKKLKQP